MRAFLFIFLLFPFSLCAHVLVSIPPQKYLAERLVGNEVEVREIVPKGASPHSFEPSPKDVQRLSGATVWFCSGENFEKRLDKALEKDVRRISQLEGIDLLYDGCCCHSGVDTHVWLSPARLKVISKRMAVVLCELYPESKEGIHQRLEALLKEISEVERKIQSTSFSRSILVSHPAFGYFCKDYGIEQLSIEVDGKEPSPKQAHALMTEVKKKNITSLFVQEQYSRRAADRFAKELELEMVSLDPYEENVITNLEVIREAFALR
jgi:zinc transport system substrate-binding protein